MSPDETPDQDAQQPPAAAASSRAAGHGGGAPPERLRGRGRLLALLLLFVLPLALRSYPLDHGLPRGYVPDAHIVRNALGMAKDKNPVPPVNRYSSYPNLLPYMLLPLYGGYFAVGTLQGRWDGAQEFGDHMLREPQAPHRIARWLVCVLASLTPLVVFAAAREAGLVRGAWFATGLLHLHFSVQERPWAPMSLFMALSAWAAIRHSRTGSARSLIVSGLLAALAFSTHQAGLLTLGLTGLAWLLAPGGWARGALVRRLRLGFRCVFLFALLAVTVGHPYLLVHGRTPAEEIVGGAEAAQGQGLSIGGMTVMFEVSPETTARLTKVFAGYDPILLLLGLLGIIPALRRQDTRAVAVWTLLWSAFFLTNSSDHVRYLLPTAVMLALFGAFPAERLARSSRGRLALALLLVLPLVQALRFVQVLDRPDTRVAAEDRLYGLPLGASIAVDRYGPQLDLDLDALERLKTLRSEQGAGLYSRERFRKSELAAGLMPVEREGFDAVRLEDVLDFEETGAVRSVRVRAGLEEYGATPEELLRGLGMTHLVLVWRRPGQQHLLAPLVAGGPDPIVIDPGGADPATEAFLPTEMDFPLTALWSVSRPGPRIEIHPLP